MKSISINNATLLKICKRIRLLKKLTSTEKREVLEVILKELDILRVTYVESLLCPKHTMEARGWANHSSVYRTIGKRNDVHVFKVCCRDFFDRKEIERKPPVREAKEGRERKIKVGIK